MTSNIELWNQVVKSIVPPNREQCIWNSCKKKNKLALVIVEPRCHELLAGVLYNMAHIYGGTDASLYLFHGNHNIEFINNIIGQWSGVHLVNLNVNNLALHQYNSLLTNITFWEHFDSEYVLIFQTDTLILKTIHPFYFQYDYIGAPWTKKWTGKHVGNGGFSLRKLSTMKEICQTKINDSSNEDYFFSSRLSSTKIAPLSIARTFAVEEIYYQCPYGLHKAYKYLTQIELVSLLLQIPHVSMETQQSLNSLLPLKRINYLLHPISGIRYGGNQVYIDVTHVFVSMIMNGCKLFKVSNYLFGDPIYLVPKQLIIEFTDGTEVRFSEGDDVIVKE